MTLHFMRSSRHLFLFWIFSSSSKDFTYGLVSPVNVQLRREQHRSKNDLMRKGSTSLKMKATLSSSDFSSRRCFINESTVVLGFIFSPFSAHALESQEDGQQQQKKPSAPLNALLPATRCKIWIDDAYKISLSLKNEDQSKQSYYTSLVKMNDILTNKPNLFTSNTIRNKKIRAPSTSTTTGVSKAFMKQYKQQREDLSPPDQLSAMVLQSGELLQSQTLKRKERALENSNDIRAAFNFYTSQIEFSADTYLLTASSEDKKRLIRNDQLPSITSVVTSDLDLRDLYRNQFLTSIEDVKAEVAYQLRQQQDDIDVIDTIALMEDTNAAITNWFNMIPTQDVQEAIDTLSSTDE